MTRKKCGNRFIVARGKKQAFRDKKTTERPFRQTNSKFVSRLDFFLTFACPNYIGLAS
jgi:hypothetical protein